MAWNEKYYSLAGHIICVRLETPWTFKELTGEQKQLVERLRRGEDIGIIPVPADRTESLSVNEQLMGKEAMTREKWDTLSPEEKDAFRHDLDFEQYAPFEESASTPLLTLRVHAGVPAELEASRAQWKLMTAVDEILPFYYGYRLGGKTLYEYFPAKGVRAGYFVMNEDYSEGDYYPCERMGARTTLMQINTSLMIQFTFASAALSTILLHASVTRLEGKAQLFFGVSGTGKSTHSRLWHEYVQESDLMNDDNPIIRLQDGKVLVYGTPWSGKTLCYRRVVAPVRALVRLEQAPENRIERLDPLQAYASVVAATSTIRWDSSIMDKIIPTVERLAMTIPCFQLSCRPDEEAVRVCREAVMSC
jgi:hypothetical protein